jgi:hypothetical protein
MYSFIFDQTYINLAILIVIVFLVMFLWRKVIILEGNFFILEKRVNLIKKDAREDSISKSIEKSDIIMNEIFKDSSRSNACPIFEYFPSTGGASGASGATGDAVATEATGATSTSADTCDAFGKCQIFKKNSSDNISINEDMVKYISSLPEDDLSDNTEKAPDIISFTNLAAITAIAADKEGDIDKIVDTIISSGEDIEINELEESNEPDNMSVSSEITFTSDDKKNDKTLQKKYSKLSLDKLKELCSANNITTEGTKNQLITRIIELKK